MVTNNRCKRNDGFLTGIMNWQSSFTVHTHCLHGLKGRCANAYWTTTCWRWREALFRALWHGRVWRSQWRWLFAWGNCSLGRRNAASANHLPYSKQFTYPKSRLALSQQVLQDDNWTQECKRIASAYNFKPPLLRMHTSVCFTQLADEAKESYQ